MKCPICKREVFYQGNPYRPFCSQRCRLIDLGNWLSGRYRISVPAENQERDDSTRGPVKSDKGGRG